MELSAEMLHSAVAHAGDRRQHIRIPFRFKVKIMPYENRSLGAPFFVWTRDICPGGIGIIHHKPIRAGRMFIIRLPREDASPVLLLCTVRACTPVAAGVFNIGADFAEVTESPATDMPKVATDQFHGGLSMRFVPAAPAPVALTDEVRRISDAILA